MGAGEPQHSPAEEFIRWERAMGKDQRDLQEPDVHHRRRLSALRRLHRLRRLLRPADETEPLHHLVPSPPAGQHSGIMTAWCDKATLGALNPSWPALSFSRPVPHGHRQDWVSVQCRREASLAGQLPARWWPVHGERHHAEALQPVRAQTGTLARLLKHSCT